MNTQTQLFLGMGMANGETVSALAFDFFLTDVVSPLLPDGFSVSEGFGRCRGTDGIVRHEPFRLLTVVWHDERAHGAPFSGFSERIESIRNAYKARFGQETTLRVDTDVTGDLR